MFSLVPFEFFSFMDDPPSKALTKTSKDKKKPAIEPRKERAMIDQISHKTERHYPNGMKEIFTSTHTRTLWER